MSAPDLSIYDPSPDAGHEAILAAVRAAFEELGHTTAGVDDSFFMADLLLGMIEQGMTERTDLASRVDALQARVAELEAHHAPLPGPDAAG